MDYGLGVVVSPEVGCGTDTTGSGGRLALVEPVRERDRGHTIHKQSLASCRLQYGTASNGKLGGGQGMRLVGNIPTITGISH